MPKPIILENAHYRLEITRPHGLITRLLDKKSESEIISEQRLAENFRLLIPMPGTECNYILGLEQKLGRVEFTRPIPQQRDPLECGSPAAAFETPTFSATLPDQKRKRQPDCRTPKESLRDSRIGESPSCLTLTWP